MKRESARAILLPRICINWPRLKSDIDRMKIRHQRFLINRCNEQRFNINE